jgi:hypothetical protein
MTTIDRRAFACGTSLVALSAFPTLAGVNASHELLVLGAQLRRAHDEAEDASAAFHAANTPMLDKAWELTLATGLDAKSNAASEMQPRSELGRYLQSAVSGSFGVSITGKFLVRSARIAIRCSAAAASF